jgi:hypothetical protein
MSRIVKGIFGGRSSSEKILQQFRPVGFSSAGATGTFDQAANRYTLTRTPERIAALEGVTSGFGAQASALRNLRSQVQPGFSRLTTGIQANLRERVAAIRSQGRSTVGSIRENLARRRLAGSSFQESEAAAAQAEFQRVEDQARAQASQAEAAAFLQEIGMSQDLIQQEFQATIGGAMAVLQDLNFDTATVSALAGQASELFNANLTAQAEARAAQEQAGEDFIGTIIGSFAPEIAGLFKKK